jgi:hypothetical protein
MIRGAVAAIRGDRSRATAALAEAVASFDAVDMRLCAAASRRRLGELRGGKEGQAEIDQANQWLIEQKIANPSKMVSMIITPWPQTGA